MQSLKIPGSLSELKKKYHDHIIVTDGDSLYKRKLLQCIL